MQATLLSIIVDNSDNSDIKIRDIAKHFNVRPISVMAHNSDLEHLKDLRAITFRQTRFNEPGYHLSQKTLHLISEGKFPEPAKIENLTLPDFINTIDDDLAQRCTMALNDDTLDTEFRALIDGNQHLETARKLKSLKLAKSDLALYLIIMMAYINNDDDHIMGHDFDDYFDRRAYNIHIRLLRSGRHPLMVAKLVEHACMGGQVDTTSWKLTDYSKNEVLAELDLKKEGDMRANLIHHEDIIAKELYYNPQVSKQVSRLRELLDESKMGRVMARLEEKGMRKGFTALLYGPSGTGKTELVKQISRLTQRDIMLVDVPSIRSKWVGETEQNVKGIFTRYKRAVKGCERAPILFFNEADAILNKRNENGVSGVDKMENSMQNILLQEMEDLEGIMIATTNLTGSLDDAFDRRFLYKMELPKPTPKERVHIWQVMLPELSEEQALQLANRYDFSGGQIENVARRHVIDEILDDRIDVNMSAIIELCETEILKRKNSASHIGFGSN